MVVFSKIGSFFNRPDWRWHIFLNPFNNFKPNTFLPHLRTAKRLSTQKYWNTDHGKYLKRFAKHTDNTITFNTRLSEDSQRIFDELDEEDQRVFIDEQILQLRSEGLSRFTFNKPEKLSINNWQWRLKYINRIDDDYFQRIIKHFTNIEHNEYIEEAIKYKYSDAHETLLRYIGYLIYIEEPDWKIAKELKFKIQQITAIRKLFFDFSNAPRSTVGNAAYLRQLVNNHIFKEADFNTFKSMNRLGIIALKAKADIKTLNEPELKVFCKDMKLSPLEKLVTLDNSVRSSQDARAFVSISNTFSNLQLEHDRLNFLRAREENERMKTEKLRGEISLNSGKDVSTDETTLLLLDTIYKESIKNNAPPNIKSFDEIVKD